MRERRVLMRRDVFAQYVCLWRRLFYSDVHSSRILTASMAFRQHSALIHVQFASRTKVEKLEVVDNKRQIERRVIALT